MRPRIPILIPLAVLAVLWGAAFVGIKRVLEDVSPFTLTVLRFAVADLCLVALMLAWPGARPRFARRDAGRLIVLGICGVPAYHLALNWGEQRTSASAASLIVAVAPVMVAVLSSLVLRERMTLKGVLGIGLSFAGVVLLSFRPESAGAQRTEPLGFAVAMLAPLSWAIYTIVAKPLLARASPVHVTAASMLIGSVALLPLVNGRFVADLASLSTESWIWIVWLGAGSSVAGYLIFVWALATIGPTRTSVSLYAVPVVALLAASVLLSEPLGFIAGAAAVLVISGVVLVQRGGVRPSHNEAITDEPVAARS